MTGLELGTLGGGSASRAWGINDSGQAIGGGDGCWAFTYSDCAMKCLSAAPQESTTAGQIIAYGSEGWLTGSILWPPLFPSLPLSASPEPRWPVTFSCAAAGATAANGSTAASGFISPLPGFR
jgi:hypothetical protein